MSAQTQTTASTGATTPPGPATQLANWWSSLHFQTQDLLVRGTLTLVVLLVAILAGRWLYVRVTRVPTGVASRVEKQGKGYVRRLAIQWRSGQRWLGWLAVLSIWSAALVIIGIIWFGDNTIDPAVRNQLARDAGAIALRIIGSLLVIGLTLSLARVLESGLFASISGSRINRNLAVLGGRLMYYAVLITGFVVILAIWGTGLVVPAVLLGAITVALSLALQDVLKNIVAGVYLLIEHPFVIDDRISVSTYSGTVEDIQLRYTALRTPDDERIYIPNSIIFTSPVTNLSIATRRRAGLTITLADGGAAALNRVEAILRAILGTTTGVASEPAPEISIMHASGGKVELRLVFWLAAATAESSTPVIAQLIDQMRAQIKDVEIDILDSAALAAS